MLSICKKSFFSVAFILSFAHTHAQRFCYIDSDYVIQQLPSYKTAQEKVKSTVEQWEKELQTKQEALDNMVRDLFNEKPLLTEPQINKREKEIFERKIQLEELQKKYFGPEGEVIRIRQQFARPVQDQIYNAVQKVAKRKHYSFVFDKANNLNIMHTDPKFDITNDVLKELGVSKK